MQAKITIPVRLAAWLHGDLGRHLERSLLAHLQGLPEVRVMRLQRAFVVEAKEGAGALLEAVHHAVTLLEEDVQKAYPVFHHEMGPLWTGTLQAAFNPPK